MDNFSRMAGVWMAIYVHLFISMGCILLPYVFGGVPSWVGFSLFATSWIVGLMGLSYLVKGGRFGDFNSRRLKSLYNLFITLLSPLLVLTIFDVAGLLSLAAFIVGLGVLLPKVVRSDGREK